MTFDNLRRKFGDILREAVPPKSLTVTMKEADKQGRVQNREIISMIVALYNYLEEQATPLTNDEKLSNDTIIQSAQ